MIVFSVVALTEEWSDKIHKSLFLPNILYVQIFFVQ